MFAIASFSVRHPPTPTAQRKPPQCRGVLDGHSGGPANCEESVRSNAARGSDDFFGSITEHVGSAEFWHTTGSATGSSTRMSTTVEEPVESNVAKGSVGCGITGVPRRARPSFGTLREGSRVMLLWGVANRDGDEFANPRSSVAPRSPGSK